MTMPLAAGDLLVYDGSQWNNQGGLLYLDTVNDRVGINTTSPASTLQVNGSLALTTVETNASSYSLAETDCILFLDAFPAGVNVFLPVASQVVGRQYTIKKLDVLTSHIVSVTANGADKIDDVQTKTLTMQYAAMTIAAASVGGGLWRWYITSRA